MGRGSVVVGGILVLGGAALAACGEGSSGGPAVQADVDASPSATAASALIDASYDGRFQIAATVLERPPGGPELCAGGVAESLPPLCGGPPIEGWDWSAVEHESAEGVQWGSYTLVGTWDGETFTMTEPATPPEPPTGGYPEYEFSVPCEPPPGGFEVPDTERAGMADFERAAQAMQGRPDIGYVAVDQSGDSPGVTAEPTGASDLMPPIGWVLIVTTTGDLAETEAAARELWGGPLCVAPAQRTGEELRAVQQAITGGESGEGLVEDFLSAGVDARNEQVTLGVLLATKELQEQMDAEFGEGLVRLEGALQPID